MGELPKVLVLLSTYNGEKYLREFLDSVFRQESVDITLLARDDGSSDSSVDVLRNYKNNGYNIQIVQGNNLGPAFSFIDLIKTASLNYREYDYYALADQDDVWKTYKLAHAVEMLKNDTSQFLLYVSDISITDAGLNIKVEHSAQIFEYYEQLLRSSAAGCVMVFNQRTLDLIARFRPDYIEMHDSWIIRVVLSVNGKIVIDHRSGLLYRKHGDNVTETSFDLKGKIVAKIISMKKKEHFVKRTSENLLRGYSDMIDDDKKKILELFSKSDRLDYKIRIIKYYFGKTFSKRYRKLFFVIDLFSGRL